jgi:uncharacterized protein YndB with AHSA1/START domain
MQAQPDPADSLVFECDFDEPPEKVWRALTEPRLLEAWLTTDDAAGVNPKEDSQDERVRGTQPVPRQMPTPSGDCEILTAEPHRLLRYRWRDWEGGVDDAGSREVHSVVTVELAPCPTGGTHLRLTHGEFKIVAAAPPIYSAGVTPIASARRRRTPIVSCAGRTSWRRAA